MTFKSQPHHVIDPRKHEGPPSCLSGAAACGLKVAKEEPGRTRDPGPGGGQVSGNRRADTCKVRPLRRGGGAVSCSPTVAATTGSPRVREMDARRLEQRLPPDPRLRRGRASSRETSANTELTHELQTLSEKTAQKSPDERHLSAKASKKNPTQTLTSCLRCGDGQRYHVGNLF